MLYQLWKEQATGEQYSSYLKQPEKITRGPDRVLLLSTAFKMFRYRNKQTKKKEITHIYL